MNVQFGIHFQLSEGRSTPNDSRGRGFRCFSSRASLSSVVAGIDEMIKAGLFNAFFVLGRSIGLIGHYFDQICLEQDLYRHPLDDILYDVPKGPEKVG